MNIKNLFHVDYWFGQPFTAQGTSLWLLIGTFLFLIVAGLVCKIVSLYQEEKFKKVLLRRAGTIGITMGFLAMVWMFFRQEAIIFLSWRFWMLLWLVVMVWQVSALVRYFLKRVPEIKSEEDRRARIEKYLPKSK
ncbi:MAG: hypothetical protein KBC69_01745 [Candidatus Magasanikbacteria bacterium]|nr:hypothetical protein [Candidatus Magasanikbacteria bacterium]